MKVFGNWNLWRIIQTEDSMFLFWSKSLEAYLPGCFGFWLFWELSGWSLLLICFCEWASWLGHRGCDNPLYCDRWSTHYCVQILHCLLAIMEVEGISDFLFGGANSHFSQDFRSSCPILASRGENFFVGGVDIDMAFQLTYPLLHDLFRGYLRKSLEDLECCIVEVDSIFTWFHFSILMWLLSNFSCSSNFFVIWFFVLIFL